MSMSKTLLDSRDEIAKIDGANVLASIEALPEQIQDAWEQAKPLMFPDDYSSVKNVVVAGMGGSALGSLIVKRLFKDELALPFEVYSHYHLPGYVNENSFVLLSSYSGNTEETLAAADQALEKKAKIATITTGGKLGELAQQHSWPTYRIEAKHNPSGEPRMAVGYAVFGQLAMFAKLGVINIAEQDILNLVDNLKTLVQRLTPEQTERNTAKLLAYQAFDHEIVLSAAEHLIGAVHVTNNQLNENAKVLTAEWHLPEFNHHFMEALTNPKKLKDDVIFLLYNSPLYVPEVSKRVELTRQVIERMGYEAEVVQATAPTKLEQVFEIVTLGSFVSFYLAMLYGVDPAPIPNVDRFKSELSKS